MITVLYKLKQNEFVKKEFSSVEALTYHTEWRERHRKMIKMINKTGFNIIIQII